MKRGHMAVEYTQKIRKLREVRPNISLSSDFIIGFPGETDKDYEDTMKLIEDIGFDKSFSFIYSARPGTPAASFEDDVPMSVMLKAKEVGEKKMFDNVFIVAPSAKIDPVLIGEVIVDRNFTIRSDGDYCFGDSGYGLCFERRLRHDKSYMVLLAKWD